MVSSEYTDNSIPPFYRNKHPLPLCNADEQEIVA